MNSVKERVSQEKENLGENLNKLSDLLSKPQPDFINDEQWVLLLKQREAMKDYFNILVLRLAEMER